MKSKIPEGFRLLSERIISDGKPKTVKATAETTEEAFTKAQSEIPNGADVLEKKELVAPERKVVTLDAFDEQNAGLSARVEARQLGGTATVRNFRLAIPGRKGFLGIGAKPNQYEAEILRPAVVEVTYKTKARTSFDLVEVKQLVAALRDADKNIRQNAMRTLETLDWQPERDADGAAYWIVKQEWDKCAEIGAPAVDPLVAALKDNDKDVRQAAVEVLGKIDTRVIEPLIAALEDSNWQVRQTAVEALGKIGDARAVEPLVAALTDSDGNVRQAAAEVLGKIGDARAIEPLVAALKDSRNCNVQQAAVEALGKIDDARVIEPLIAALEDSSWGVRQAAAEALGKIGDARAVEPLVAALKEVQGYEVVRRVTAEALVKIGTSAVESLVTALKSSNWQVRQAAVEAWVRLVTPVPSSHSPPRSRIVASMCAKLRRRREIGL